MSLFTELKRRNVFKAGALYLVSSWVILQVAELLLDALELPETWLRLILVFLVLGFPLLLIFSWVYEITPEGIKREEDVLREESITSLTGRRINLMILLLLAVAVALQVIGYLTTGTDTLAQSTAITATTQPENQSSFPDTPSTLTDDTPTIAVLPFANMSDDPKQEYFADGVAEEILNSLSRISHLQVRGRTSSFYFKGRSEDLKSIASQLNVDHILEGSVRKSGNRVRITVQLIDVPSDTHLWSRAYDRVLDDIFAIQEDIATSVASSLEVSLGVGELGSEPGMTRNVTAYELYLEARKQIGYSDRSHTQRAIELLEQAVETDPQFALAWALLANLYSAAAQLFMPDQASQYLDHAAEAATRAGQLAPDMWSLLLHNANKLQAQNRWQQAEEILRNLEKTTLGSYPVNNTAALFEANVGHPEAGLAHLATAAREEPLNMQPVVLSAGLYTMLGDYEAAQVAYEKSETLPIGNLSVVFAGELYLAMAQRDQAAVKRSLEEYLTQSSRSIPGIAAGEFISLMATLLDSPPAALEALRRFDAESEPSPLLRSSMMAAWAAYFGDPKLALDLQYRDGKADAAYATASLWLPVFVEMRRLPGFKQLVIDLGLVDYWRATGNWGDFCKPIGENDFECH